MGDWVLGCPSPLLVCQGNIPVWLLWSPFLSSYQDPDSFSQPNWALEWQQR